MELISDPPQLAAFHDGAFVPTMGSLHEGHLSLVRAAAAIGTPVVVSVFVNPTQFGPDEDYERYPRQLERDVEAAGQAGADVVFAPAREAIYPEAHPVDVPPLPAVATAPGLEDACRPGHFAGVCQVVARLLDLVRPAAAVFGEKDYQQLLVIEAMVDEQRPRWGRLQIVRGPTVREHDGLAMSSRNAYLDAGQRGRALGLSRALRAAADAAARDDAERVMRETLASHDLQVDYAVVRDAETLMSPVPDGPRRGLVAARVGAVRLIDNRSL